jgi:uncharacterized protein YraI
MRMKLVLTGLLSMMTVLAAVESGTTVTMAKRGNIRYGPSLEAGVIVTLDRGTEVQILGKAEGQPGWYRIRFPRQGRAWMHSRNLAETDREGVLQVTYDGVSVRSDARITAEKIAEMAVGETVEWSGRRVGQWYAVYPPSAVAYTYQSVLDLTPAKQQEVVAQEREDLAIETTWKEAERRYRAYYDALQRDAHDALSLDWPHLATMLEEVVSDHPDLRTRLVAQKLRSKIGRIVKASAAIPAERRRAMPDQPAGSAVAAQQPTQQPAQPAAQEAVQDDDGQQAALEPVAPADQRGPTSRPLVGGGMDLPEAEDDLVTGTATPAAEVDAEPVAIADGELQTVLAEQEEGVGLLDEVGGERVGWLQELEKPELGTRYVLIGDGVEAFLKLPPGSDIDLGEFHWRRVRVQGTPQTVDHEVAPEYRGVPLILVESVRMAR